MARTPPSWLVVAGFAVMATFRPAVVEPAGVVAPPLGEPGYARPAPKAAESPLLAATRAGRRVVAVGEYGNVLLSDDDGKSWRQAKSVATTTTLTAVHFLDADRGWAVGHGGVVAATKDGGETWTVLDGKASGPDVLFSIRMDGPDRGLAVGSYGRAIRTIDGGRRWEEFELATGEDGERHLNQIIGAGNGALLIAAEGGTVFRSADGGSSWQIVRTPYKGSLWGGLALADGSILVYGMRGKILRSADAGRTWSEVGSGTDQSLTGACQAPAGTIVVVGLGGAVGVSDDGGRTFATRIRSERTSHSAVVCNADRTVIVFGAQGVQSHPLPPPARP